MSVSPSPAATIFSRVVALIGAMVPVVTLVVYFARIDPSMSDLKDKLHDQQQAQVQMKADFERGQADQNARVDRIEEGRREGLQRLAKVEEALAAMKDGFSQINTKLDRIIFERRR